MLGLGSALLVAGLAASADGLGRADTISANKAPRITAFSARIGRVYEEGGGYRNGGLTMRFALCDDGPENVVGRRYARISVTHRWGSRRAERLLVREQEDLITYDIHFVPPECVRGIPWTSTVPADLPRTRFYRCYSVTLRVRDPAGRWSNSFTRVVRGCVPGQG